jgi:hypothetical protein
MPEFDLDKIAEVHRQIRVVLIRDWDPIGVGGTPGAATEYFGYERGACDVAVTTRSAEAVARHLLEMEQERMGLPPRSLGLVLPIGEKIVEVVSEI